jgi:exosome complex RNA-binding protein Csl4
MAHILLPARVIFLEKAIGIIRITQLRLAYFRRQSECSRSGDIIPVQLIQTLKRLDSGRRDKIPEA